MTYQSLAQEELALRCQQALFVEAVVQLKKFDDVFDYKLEEISIQALYDLLTSVKWVQPNVAKSEIHHNSGK